MLIVLSLSALYLLGLGYLVLRPFLAKVTGSFDQIALPLCLGILVNHGLLLLLQKLENTLLLTVVLSAAGLVLFALDHIRRPRRIKAPLVPVLFVIYLLALYYVRIFSEPISEWDARSIWFLHAKIICARGSLGRSAGWSDPSLSWAHVDYPKLIPALAAQLAYLRGYWNEYFPKGALFLALVPPVLWIFSFSRKSFSFLFLVLVSFFILERQLWNGYMDGYLALYASTAILLFGRYFQERRSIDLVSGLIALETALNLKNEGALFVLSAAVALVVVAFAAARLRRADSRRFFALDRRGWMAVAAGLVPAILWLLDKHLWGLGNDLQVGSASSVSRLFARLTDHSSLGLIFRAMFVQLDSPWKAAALLAGALVLSILLRQRLSSAPWLATIAALLYFCGLFSIYLLTPLDLRWHLSSSVDRTALTGALCLLVGVFFVLSDIEKGYGKSPEPRERISADLR